MGKPFQNELEHVISTFAWSIEQDTSELRKAIVYDKEIPLLIIGSGGSLSACYFAEYLCQQVGIFAKAMTPLDLLYSKNIIHKSNLLFISASGRNTDILYSYKTASRYEPNKILSLCMTTENPLNKLAKENSIASVYGYNNPAGKDGFLATNSLVGFFGVLYKTFYPEIGKGIPKIDKIFQKELNLFIRKVTAEFTFVVLYAAPGKAVAFDLESKLSEAALGDVLISDYRNFGHGRHHWFAKRSSKSAIIALITPEEKDLAMKTLSLLPKEVPILCMSSSSTDPLSTISLLIKSFHFVNELGKIQNIDPGRPGVPGFGSKLYHLSYQKLYDRSNKDIAENAKLAILRKTGVESFDALSETKKKFWVAAYRSFLKKINSAEFGVMVFDYDGTLCSSQGRYLGIDHSIVTEFRRFLASGIIIGIATGRGQSVRQDLQRVIPQKYWEQVVVGYYNGSDVGLLADDSRPDKGISASANIQFVFNKLKDEYFFAKIVPEIKPHQITIEVTDVHTWPEIRLAVTQFVQSLGQAGIQIVESSHSLDIIDSVVSSKINVISHCTELAADRDMSVKALCIGDKGKWPGNDFQLLATDYSLSVDEVSVLPGSCWNLSPPGIKNTMATINYLSCLTFEKKGVKFKTMQ